MRCKTMAQGVNGPMFRNARIPDCFFNDALNSRIGNVMSAYPSTARINGEIAGGENVT